MKWYIIYTKPHWGKQVADVLARKKITTYSPANRVIDLLGRKEKILLQPLLPGYLFVRLHESQRTELIMIRGIINFVYWLKEPAVIKDAEVNLMQQFLKDHNNVALKKVTPSFTRAARYNEVNREQAGLMAGKSETAQLALPSLGYIMTAITATRENRIIPVGNVGRENLIHGTYRNTA